MEATVIFLFIILSGLAGLVVLLAFRKKTATSTEDASSDYAEALNLLLAGRDEEALNKLRETVNKNSHNIDAYLKIGDILRKLGQIERAINVHKYLTVRKGLSAKQHKNILESLALDYQAAGQYERALEVLVRALEADKKANWAREMKLSLYEEMGDWTKAFQTLKELKSKNGKFDFRRLASYKIREGLIISEIEENEKKAQACFNEAIKIDAECVAGYIALADSFQRENRTDDALNTLKRFMKKVPKQSFLAFSRIKDLLYEGGVFGEIENIYQEIIDTQPDNLMARLALAEIFEKKGEYGKAIEECQAILDRDIKHKSARKFLIKLYHKAKREEEALTIALELIDESLSGTDTAKFELEDFLDEVIES